MRDLQQNADAVHKFERAGLGKAPFRFVGTYKSIFQAVPGDSSCPIQPGTSCDYCAQGIMYVCKIESADGRSFKVGSECVAKTGDAGLMKLASQEERRRNRNVRHAREAEKIAELTALLDDESVRAKLATLPHPRASSGGIFTGLTFADWVANVNRCARATGKVRLLKAIRAVL